MNTMRVFLHDLLWQQDPKGFTARIDRFLAIAEKHQIRPMIVLFDSVWDPQPKLGKQRAPTPGVHNSGWLQSPGAAALQDKTQWPRLEAYVKGVVGAFANDRRVLAWDIWNEPDNMNGSSYKAQEPANKVALVQRRSCRRRSPGRASARAEPAADERRLDRRLVDRRQAVRDREASRSRSPTSSRSTTTTGPRSSTSASAG